MVRVKIVLNEQRMDADGANVGVEREIWCSIARNEPIRASLTYSGTVSHG